jgi:hypothetical protein
MRYAYPALRMLLQGVGGIAASGGSREGPAVLMIELNGLFDDLAKLGEDFLFILAVTSTVQQPGSTADVALVLLGPLDDLCVERALFHGESGRSDLQVALAVSAASDLSALSAKSAPLGQATVPQTGASVPLEKYASSRSGSNTGPLSRGQTSTTFDVPSLKRRDNRCPPTHVTLVIRRISFMALHQRFDGAERFAGSGLRVDMRVQAR